MICYWSNFLIISIFFLQCLGIFFQFYTISRHLLFRFLNAAEKPVSILKRIDSGFYPLFLNADLNMIFKCFVPLFSN